MISDMIIAAAAFGIIGLAAMLLSTRRAPTGYEDPFGFHEGAYPENDFYLADEVKVGAEAPKPATPPVPRQPKRAMMHAYRDPVSYGETVHSAH